MRHKMALAYALAPIGINFDDYECQSHIIWAPAVPLLAANVVTKGSANIPPLNSFHSFFIDA